MSLLGPTLSERPPSRNAVLVILPVSVVVLDGYFSLAWLSAQPENRGRCVSDCLLGLFSIPFPPVVSPLTLAKDADGFLTAGRVGLAYVLLIATTAVWWWYLSGVLTRWAEWPSALVRGLLQAALFVVVAMTSALAKAFLWVALDDRPGLLLAVEAALWAAAIAVIRRRAR